MRATQYAMVLALLMVMLMSLGVGQARAEGPKGEEGVREAPLVTEPLPPELQGKTEADFPLATLEGLDGLDTEACRGRGSYDWSLGPGVHTITGLFPVTTSCANAVWLAVSRTSIARLKYWQPSCGCYHYTDWKVLEPGAWRPLPMFPGVWVQLQLAHLGSTPVRFAGYFLF